MKHAFIAAAMLIATPAMAYRDDGGSVAYYAQQVWAHQGPKRIGWFSSAAALWLGNPGACVDSGSMVHIHPVVDPVRARAYNIPSVWAGIISPHTTFDHVNSYASVMSATPWGRRVFRTAEARGCFADPNGCNFYAGELVALGVPVCRGGY